MAEPARQLSDRENAVALRLVKQESRNNIGQGADSGSNIASLNDHRAQKGQAGPAPDVRQARAKARQDMDPRNKITNIDDYQTQRGQAGPGAEREGLSDNSQPAGGMSGEADQAKERPNPFQSASVDPALLRQQQEEQKASEQADTQRDVNRARADKKMKGGGWHRDYSVYRKALDSEKKAHSKTSALIEGVKLGAFLRGEIKNANFDAFVVVLILSVSKDVIDGITLGTVGMIVNIFLASALFIVFFLQRSWFKRFLIKRFLGRYIIVIIAEFIPGFNIFPAYTFMAIFLKIKIDKKRKKHEEELKELERNQ